MGRASRPVRGYNISGCQKGSASQIVGNMVCRQRKEIKRKKDRIPESTIVDPFAIAAQPAIISNKKLEGPAFT
jgi:hypothetical protein